MCPHTLPLHPPPTPLSHTLTHTVTKKIHVTVIGYSIFHLGNKSLDRVAIFTIAYKMATRSS